MCKCTVKLNTCLCGTKHAELETSVCFGFGYPPITFNDLPEIFAEWAKREEEQSKRDREVAISSVS